MPLTPVSSLTSSGLWHHGVCFTIYLSFNIGDLPDEPGFNISQLAGFRSWWRGPSPQRGWNTRFSGWTGFWFLADGFFFIMVGTKAWIIPARRWRSSRTWFWRTRWQIADADRVFAIYQVPPFYLVGRLADADWWLALDMEQLNFIVEVLDTPQFQLEDDPIDMDEWNFEVL